MARTPKPPKSFWFAHVVRATVGVVLRALFRVEILHPERIPEGGVVLAANHLSYADPVLFWCASPRPVHFMARADLWGVPVIGWALDHFWALPVKRGAADREALQRASGHLQAGEPVGIFPEGTRKFKNAEDDVHGGAAFLAIRNGVPVVPVGFAGTDRIKPPGRKLIHFPKVVIAIGEPIDPASIAEGGRKERVDALTKLMMTRIDAQARIAEEASRR